MVQFLLHMNPTIASIKSKKDKLALHFACGDGHVDVVRALLRVHPEGAFISSQKGKLPLHFAARWGHGLIAEDLLRLNKKSAEHRDLEGSLPLHDAAREGQTAMSQFLLQQFPQGARVANLRGEIPLFPAIRSGNLSLVVTLLQAWPLGGRHILESIQESDAVHDWDWSIVELLLRGAAENFNGCPNIPSLGGECNCKQKSRPKSPIMDQETTPTAGETARNSSCFKKRALPTPFCDESTAANNKRRCTNTVRNTATTQLSRQQSQFRVQSQQNNSCRMRADESLYRCKFLALHTVLAVTNAPVQVLEIVLKRQCDLLHETDCRGQLPLHIAAAHCKEDEDRAEFIVKNLLCCPDDAKHRDSFGRIPLHIALEHQASFTLTKALLEAYPKSGVKMEDDEGMFPLRLAAERDCDLSTIYSLLRIDPSVLVVNHPV